MRGGFPNSGAYTIEAPKGGYHVRGTSIVNKTTAADIHRSGETKASGQAPHLLRVLGTAKNIAQMFAGSAPRSPAMDAGNPWGMQAPPSGSPDCWPGQTTIAAALEERLVTSGRPAFMLDGEDSRHGPNGDLGFNEAAGSENVRRTAHVARLLAESGTLAIVSLVSPYAEDREAAASLHADADLPFWRSSSTLRCSCVRSATRRGSTRALGRASSPA